MKQNKGLILFVMLLFLQLISLLSLSVFDFIAAQTKLNRANWHEETLFYSLESILSSIEKNNLANLSCLVNPMTIDAISAKSLSWWQQHACSGQTELVNYFYIIDLLTSDPCATIRKDAYADYYRITLFGLFKNNSEKKYLQSIVIFPHLGLLSSCQQTLHRVTIGRQMWRII